MTDNEIIIAVAKIAGFKWCDHVWGSVAHNTRGSGRNVVITGSNKWCQKCGAGYNDDGTIIAISQLPNYLTSRDAIIPVIEKVCMTKPNLRYEFGIQLSRVKFDAYALQIDYDQAFQLYIEATPLQLCTALLKAKGLWK